MYYYFTCTHWEKKPLKIELNKSCPVLQTYLTNVDYTHTHINFLVESVCHHATIIQGSHYRESSEKCSPLSHFYLYGVQGEVIFRYIQ